MNTFLAIAALSFSPILEMPSRAFEAFLKSFSLMIVVIFAAIPWIALFLLASWGALRFLRWWVKRRRELKEKNRQPAVTKPAL
jgi:ABC-type transport system involved in cytochrome c biogenesis permease subunit